MSIKYLETFLDTNEWVPIHSLPGLECCIEYFVNNKGEVLSHKGKTPRLLKPQPDSNGYLGVLLQQRLGRKKPKRINLHILVAFAFLPSPPIPYGARKGCCNIDHIDENKTNNNVDNLRWLTMSENQLRQKRCILDPTEEQLKHRTKNRETARRARANPDKLEQIREYHRSYYHANKQLRNGLK